MGSSIVEKRQQTTAAIMAATAPSGQAVAIQSAQQPSVATSVASAERPARPKSRWSAAVTGAAVILYAEGLSSERVSARAS